MFYYIFFCTSKPDPRHQDVHQFTNDKRLVKYIKVFIAGRVHVPCAVISDVIKNDFLVPINIQNGTDVDDCKK